MVQRFCLRKESNPLSQYVNLVARRYTDRAISVHQCICLIIMSSVLFLGNRECLKPGRGPLTSCLKNAAFVFRGFPQASNRSDRILNVI
jgi:hypothetical protein